MGGTGAFPQRLPPHVWFVELHGETTMSDQDQKRLQVGAAESIITPSLGTELAGYFSPRVSDGVISDLRAKAVVAGDGPDRIALIACDLLTIAPEITAAVRAAVTRETGIASEKTMVC